MEFFKKSFAIAVIQIDTGALFTLQKKAFFYLIVVLHGLMIVQMILTQVGKTAVSNANIGDPPLVDAMGGNFHHTVFDLLPGYLAE